MTEKLGFFLEWVDIRSWKSTTILIPCLCLAIDLGGIRTAHAEGEKSDWTLVSFSIDRFHFWIIIFGRQFETVIWPNKVVNFVPHYKGACMMFAPSIYMEVRRNSTLPESAARGFDSCDSRCQCPPVKRFVKFPMNNLNSLIAWAELQSIFIDCTIQWTLWTIMEI